MCITLQSLQRERHAVYAALIAREGRGDGEFLAQTRVIRLCKYAQFTQNSRIVAVFTRTFSPGLLLVSMLGHVCTILCSRYTCHMY